MSFARTSLPMLSLLASILITAALLQTAYACAVCVGSSPEDAGYFWGMLFLMSMPFAVGGLFGGWFVYAYRQQNAAIPQESAEHHSRPLKDRDAASGPASAET